MSAESKRSAASLAKAGQTPPVSSTSRLTGTPKAAAAALEGIDVSAWLMLNHDVITNPSTSLIWTRNLDPCPNRAEMAVAMPV